MSQLPPVTPAERICNLVPTPEHYKPAITRGFSASPTFELLANSDLPPTVDLRRTWWTIGDQGKTGSCMGWASTDGALRYMLVTAGRLDQRVKLSPRFTYMAAKELDNVVRPESMIERATTWSTAALEVLCKYGAVTEDMLPFDIDNTMYMGDEEAFFNAAAQYKIARYQILERDPDLWRQWLAQHGPLIAGLSVDDTWFDASSTAGKLDTFHSDSVKGGHAVVVVGYTADGRFIVRNSWGKGWGDEGFAYPSEGYIKGAFFEETYALTL